MQRHSISDKILRTLMSLIEHCKIKPVSAISDPMKIRYSVLYHKCILRPHITP